MSATQPVATELLTAREVARCLSVSERTIWRWTKQGVLPAPVYPGGRSTRWRKADIRQFLDNLSPPRDPAA
jgi:excisionase family DNA binding protein